MVGKDEAAGILHFISNIVVWPHMFGYLKSSSHAQYVDIPPYLLGTLRENLYCKTSGQSILLNSSMY
jgi:hypothetical protein